MIQRVLLTTGGTGGHIFPALAVAEELRRRNPGVDLLFMGSLYGPEKRLAAEAGVPFVGLPVRGFLGRGLAGIAALGRMSLAIPRALAVVHRFHPDAAAGFGSYAAFAPLLAARILGVPAVLHEQNAVAGASNRFLSRLTARVCVSLPDTKGFTCPVVVTGNPVRRDVFAVGGQKRGFDRRHLLIVGGSLGAHALNKFMVEMLPVLKKAGVSIRHQTGVRDEPVVKEAYARAGYDPSCVTAFINDMPGAYSWADLVLCRAGASTVAELCGAGVPSILVPYPYAAGDHQTGNARALEQAGAAVLFQEKSLSASFLGGTIIGLFGEPDRLAMMSRAALGLARCDAASRVADQIEAVAVKRQ